MLYGVSWTEWCYSKSNCNILKALHLATHIYFSSDCTDLLKAAIRDPDPVIFLENEIAYGHEHGVSDSELSNKDYPPKIDKAALTLQCDYLLIYLLLY